MSGPSSKGERGRPPVFPLPSTDLSLVLDTETRRWDEAYALLRLVISIQSGVMEEHALGGPSPSHHLPVELLRQILTELASISPSSAALASSLSRAIRQWTQIYLHQSIAIRSRSQLRRTVGVLARDEARRKVLRCVYVNNRAEPIDGGVQAARARRQRRWDRPQVLELEEVEGGAQAWGGAGPQAPALDEDQEEEEEADDDDDEWPALALGFLFRHCPNLEFVHIHEPFSINYPSEISSVFHLVAYPLHILRSSAQSYEEILCALSAAARSGRRGESVTLTAGSTQRFAKPSMPRLKELTISALALKPEHLAPFEKASVPAQDSAEWSATLPPPAPTPSPLASLERLHLHWPTLIVPLVEALLPLPRLTHLRLTRPSPHGLVSGVRRLLRQKAELKLLIVELGWYLEGPTLEALGEMEDEEVLRCKENGEQAEAEAGPPPEAEAIEGGAQRDPFVVHRHAASRLRLLGRDRERKIWQQGWLTGAYDEEGALREFRDRSDEGIGCWGWR